MTGQFRQSVFGRLGGYDDVNDADRLGRDPAMRWIVGGKAIERQAASISQMGRFETEPLATDENVGGIDGQAKRQPDPEQRTMVTSAVPLLFLFNQFGDLERCSLRPGNVHSADGWRNVLEPVVMRYKERKVRLYFRGEPHRRYTKPPFHRTFMGYSRVLPNRTDRSAYPMSRRMPFLDVVRAFEVAARHLSFSHAANKLGVTQGAIGRLDKAPVGRSPRKDLKMVEDGFRACAPILSLPTCSSLSPDASASRSSATAPGH